MMHRSPFTRSHIWEAVLPRGFRQGNSPSQHRLTLAFPKREQARAVLGERETRDHQAPSGTNEWPEMLDTGEHYRLVYCSDDYGQFMHYLLP